MKGKSRGKERALSECGAEHPAGVGVRRGGLCALSWDGFGIHGFTLQTKLVKNLNFLLTEKNIRGTSS